MGKVITVATIKGGTGKTATAGALAQAAAAAGRRAAVIDLDPQANISLWFNADLSRPGSYDVIARGAAAGDLFQGTACGVDILPAGANLATLQTGPGSAQRLDKALDPIKESYDLVMIDCGPAMGEALNNALFSSTGLLIPLETDSNSLQGLYQIADIAKHVQESNQALRILGAVVTKYDGRAKINRFYLDTIQETAAALGIPFLSAIRAGVAIREAMATATSLYSYAPRSKPAQDYKTLYNRIMED